MIWLVGLGGSVLYDLEDSFDVLASKPRGRGKESLGSGSLEA